MPIKAFAIETGHHTAGIAVRERAGFRFYAAHSLFQALDNRTFRRLRDLRNAIEGFAPRRAQRDERREEA